MMPSINGPTTPPIVNRSKPEEPKKPEGQTNGWTPPRDVTPETHNRSSQLENQPTSPLHSKKPLPTPKGQTSSSESEVTLRNKKPTSERPNAQYGAVIDNKPTPVPRNNGGLKSNQLADIKKTAIDAIDLKLIPSKEALDAEINQWLANHTEGASDTQKNELFNEIANDLNEKWAITNLEIRLGTEIAAGILGDGIAIADAIENRVDEYIDSYKKYDGIDLTDSKLLPDIIAKAKERIKSDFSILKKSGAKETRQKVQFSEVVGFQELSPDKSDGGKRLGVGESTDGTAMADMVNEEAQANALKNERIGLGNDGEIDVKAATAAIENRAETIGFEFDWDLNLYIQQILGLESTPNLRIDADEGLITIPEAVLKELIPEVRQIYQHGVEVVNLQFLVKGWLDDDFTDQGFSSQQDLTERFNDLVEAAIKHIESKFVKNTDYLNHLLEQAEQRRILESQSSSESDTPTEPQSTDNNKGETVTSSYTPTDNNAKPASEESTN